MYLQNAKRVFGMKELTPDVFIDMSGVRKANRFPF